MTNKQNRRIAFFLVILLLINTVALPVQTTASDIGFVGEIPADASTNTSIDESTDISTDESTDISTDETMDTSTDESTDESTDSSGDALADTSTDTPIDSSTNTASRESLLAAQQEGYQNALSYFNSMDISAGAMPLEWWYVMTGNASMKEPDYSILETMENQDLSAAQVDASIETTWADYIIFPETISIHTAADLILLSYVSPSLYQYSTITLFADKESKFDLVNPIVFGEQTFSYRGLGSQEVPYSGTVRYGENSDDIAFILNTSLFIGLSSKAKFLNDADQLGTVTLISKAEQIFDGLLAQHVLGEKENSADWHVRLLDPENSDGIAYQLPSVLGIMYGNTDVNLTLVDDSSLPLSSRGYLCAVMHDDASLTAWNITREVSVPLVGELSSNAVLTTEASQEDANEEMNNLDASELTDEKMKELMEAYCAQEVKPGEMSLEWWLAVCGKSDELRTYLTQKSAEASALMENSAENEIATFSEEATEENVITLSISSSDELIKLSKVTASEYSDKTINITASSGTFDISGNDFIGLGGNTSTDAFAGKITYSNASERASITLSRALFNGLSADAQIAAVNLTWGGTTSQANNAAILANTVYSGETNNANWTVNLGKHSGDTSANDYSLPSLIQSIESGAQITLSVNNNSTYSFSGQGFFCDNLKGALTANYPSKLPTFSTSKDNVGGIVGSMTESAELTVKASEEIVIDLSTTGKTAGGLVGKMEDGAKLTVDANSISVKQVTAAVKEESFVGSLVGEATNPVLSFGDKITSITADKATESHGYHLNGYTVGGIVGKLAYTRTANLPVPQVNELKMRGINCGGLFGELDSSDSFSVSNYEITVTLNRYEPDEQDGKIEGIGSTVGDSTAGGLIGLYTPAKKATLSLSDITATVTAETKTLHALGGMIGTVAAKEEGSYIQLSNCESTCILNGKAERFGGMVGMLTKNAVHFKASGTVVLDTEQSNGCTGGLVGLAEDQGHLIEVDDFTLTAGSLSGDNSGGLVGEMQSGTVYMNARPTLKITKFATSATHGWIMGKRDNVLVCTSPGITDWVAGAVRENPYGNNDTGVWGQVLQLDKFENLVTLDSANHKVTVRSMPVNGNNGYEINSLTDFAAVALRIQLDAKGLLEFEDNVDYEKNAVVEIDIKSNIDLTDTGLTGLTRDWGVRENHSYEITGNNHTITLPSVRIFASGSGHSYQGLIAHCDSLDLNELVVAGGGAIESSTAVRAGIVGELRNTATINETTSSIEWTISGVGGSSTLSGFIGNVKTDDKISFENSIWNGTLKDDSNTNSLCIMGGFLGDSNDKSPSITVTKCTVSGEVKNTVQKNNSTEAMVGGLFGRLWKCASLTVNDLTVSDATVNTTSAKNSGGLLGYELNGTATFDGVVICNSTLTTNAKFGGLIYKGAGYWTVTGNGIIFKSATISGTTKNDTPSGLLVSVGCSGEENYGGLYLEVGYDTYKIQNVTLTLNDGNYFDELVGRSIQEVGSGRNGIVSIATNNHEGIDTTDGNTYQKQLTSDYTNPCTRYYYNLDKFSETKLDDTIDSAADMVLWSAYNECKNCTVDGKEDSVNSGLWKYFASNQNSRTIAGTIDLTGYSFYPVVFDGTSINNAAITFGFQNLEDTENDNKKPSDHTRQHAGMHTGIFTTAVNENEDDTVLTLTVNTLTLSGTVGAVDAAPENYGAIIRDNAEGKNATALTVLNISNVKLSGIRVYPEPAVKEGNLKPLLINGIGNYTTLNLTNVTVPENTYTGEDRIATSLIGRVGSKQENIASNNIQLTFKGIRLAENGQSGSKCSLFTHALFMESFEYSSDTCKGVYNFTKDEPYTVGQEVSISKRNPEKQYWFFNEWNSDEGYVCGNAANAKITYKDYFPYVCKGESEEGNFHYHEIDVNKPTADLLMGCGTYSDPYRISNGEMLQELAKALQGSGKNESWKVKVNTNVLQNGQFVGFDKDDRHIYTQSEEEGNSEQILTSGLAGWSASGTETSAENAEMLKYLQNAYYMITENITLSNWGGLGDHSGTGTDNRAFKGVIIGEDENITVTIQQISSTSQFGGLIKFSEGSVVKNLKVAYGTSRITLSNVTTAPSSIATASFFGGVVGYCFGGDTIIDNVSVDFTNATITASRNYSAVGGYVGLVGGASNQGGGGVVFRNNIASTLKSNDEDKYYYNPYVGRVLDGYAISENTTLENGDNYTIPVLNVTPSLKVDETAVTVGNAEGLWLLSAMENSRHGNAYTNGKGRNGTYDTIGNAATDEKLTDEKNNSSYFSKKYKVTLPTDPYSIKINADCDMTEFKNGFRGIGVSQGMLKNYGNEILQLTGIDGDSHTITLNQNRNEVNGENEAWASMGAGLFPILRCEGDVTVQQLTLAGRTELTAGDVFQYKDKQFDSQRSMVGVGLLAGSIITSENDTALSLKIEEVQVSGTVTSNVPSAGGLIGWCGSKWGGYKLLKKLEISNCSASGSVTVTGCTNIGGFIGFAGASSVNVNKFDGSNITVNPKESKILNTPGVYNNIKFYNGLGGVFGVIYNAELNVQNVTLSGLNISNSNADGTNDIGLGGFAGCVSTSNNSKNEMKKIAMSGNVTDTNSNASAGGVIGFLTDTDKYTGWEGNSSNVNSQFTLNGVTIGSDCEETKLSARQTGGVIGMVKDGLVDLKIGGARDENKVTVGNSNSEVTIEPSSYSNSRTVGGVIGVTCNNPSITVQNLLVQNVSVNAKNDKDCYTSMILAWSSKACTKFQLNDIEITGCKLYKKSDDQTGFLYGNVTNAVPLSGFNILIKDSQSDARGIFGGKNANDSSHTYLVGVSVVGCSALTERNTTALTTDIHSAKDYYVIRANYTGAQNYHDTGNEPWVNLNPLSNLNGKVDDISPITGDGTAFVTTDDGNSIPIGKMIANETKNDQYSNYYAVKDAEDYFKDNGMAEKSGISISSFLEAGSNSVSKMPDFPVLVLPTVSKTEMNTAIYNYISLLTNYVSSEKSLKDKLNSKDLTQSITAKTYQWDEQQQKFVDTGESSVTVNKEGMIYATPGKYDNTKNQFTLLTVSFKDPTNESNFYKLYIPILVQKLLNYQFYASAISGTIYTRDAYLERDSLAITTHGDQITVLLTYEYDNEVTAWQNSLDNGENLLWNFDKTIVLNGESTDTIPKDTWLTLVDRNNQDKVYYVTYSGSGNISLKDFEDADGKSYTKNFLCDGLGLKVEKNANGKFVMEKDSSKATVRVGTTYYRLAADADSSAEKYAITVTKKLMEEYYLTIQTPKGSDEFANVMIECENSLTNSDKDGRMIPNKFKSENANHAYTRNSSENRILFGNFFTQEVSVSTSTAEEISDANNTINATLTTKINYKDDEWRKRFEPYANSVRLWQRFELQARDWTNESSYTSTSFTSRFATVSYYNGDKQVGETTNMGYAKEDIMVLKFPEGVKVSTSSLNAATLSVKVSLIYEPAQIQEQFRTRTSENTREGLQLWANSHLAYSEDALARSNSFVSAGDMKRFYRADSSPANLVYHASGSADRDERTNQLGINGHVENEGKIDSAATYNVSKVNEAKNADQIFYSITLYRKTDDGTFEYVENNSLLKEGAISATLTNGNNQEETVIFESGVAHLMNGIDPSIPIQISLPLTVASGENFTGTYANYKVELAVWLQNGENQIVGSKTTDYIIYTNAKIKFPLVTSNENQ